MSPHTTAPRTPAALDRAERIAAQLRDALLPPPDQPWHAHSLAQGASGTALLHIERAHRSHALWRHAHPWVARAAAGEISAADNTGLFLGAPAVAFTLAATGPVAPYRKAAEQLHRAVLDLTHRRTTTAMERIRRGALPDFGEYDLFYGLTGLGAYLLHHDPDSSALERVLTYLVALTRPLRLDDQTVPGWWVHHDPRRGRSAHFPHGHANHGVAHGISGPLLLLAQAMRRGRTVEGHHEAITALCTHLDTWEQKHPAGPWWPEHLTLRDLATRRPHQTGPARPSWCYGTPGLARAQQLAAIATADPDRQRAAEHALAACLTDPRQTSRITDAGLCHGWGGIHHTAWHAARDATTPRLRTLLPHLADQLTRHPAAEPGFLDGAAGTALALLTAATDTAPTTGWDTCLLIH